MSEAGVSWEEYDLSDTDAEDEEIAKKNKRIRQAASLPGVSVGEAKDAYTDKELHVWGVAFSADMQQFAAATTHGVFIYSSDGGLGNASAMGGGGAIASDAGRFVPQMLTKKVSGPLVVKALEAGDLTRAMILALALNDYGLLRTVYEKIPADTIPAVVASIGAPLLPALIWFIGLELRPSTGSPHFQFHMAWIAALIDLHFTTLSELSTGKVTARTGAALEAAAASRSDVAALCLQLLMELSQRHVSMAKTFDSNTYLLRFLSATAQADDSSKEVAADKATGGTGDAALDRVLAAVAKAEAEADAEGPKQTKAAKKRKRSASVKN